MKLVALATLLLVSASLLLYLDGEEEAGAASYTAIDAGSQHTCAISSGGGLQCWGQNEDGQVGDGTQMDRTHPTQVAGLTSGVVDVSTGTFHTCAVTATGGVQCWGRNNAGQLGDGTVLLRLTPVSVCASGSGSGCTPLTGVVDIAAGDRHTCAVTSAGGVKCWGGNADGQLGDGTTTGRLLPVDVTGLSSGVTAVDGGLGHTCARTTSGAVKCWGFNSDGQVGDGTQVSRITPVDVVGLSSGVEAIAVGEVHSCAVLSGANAKCWGNNLAGQLGTGSDSPDLSAVPVDVTLSDVSLIAAGGGHTCAAQGGGALYCWGWDGFGQLGDDIADPLQHEAYSPQLVWGITGQPGEQTVLSLSAGAGHTCAVLSPSGLSACWGWNSDGQLGDGTQSDRPSWRSVDSDRDGCTDGAEANPASGSEVTGGRRNPKNFWDFFDTPDDTATALTAIVYPTGITPSSTVQVSSTAAFPASGTFFIATFGTNGQAQTYEKFSYDSKTATSFHITGRALDRTPMLLHQPGAETFVVSGVRDGVVNDADVSRANARYNKSGDQNGDPLAPPHPTPKYHPAFDRKDDPSSSEPWDLIQGDGRIRVADFTYMNYQRQPVDHDCS